MNADRNEELGGDDIHVFFCPPKLRIRYIIMLTAFTRMSLYMETHEPLHVSVEQTTEQGWPLA